MDHIFISYASGDLAKVDSFRQLLLQQSIPCWMAPYDIPAGQRYAYAVTTSLRHCACAVVLYSAKTMQSENVERELECAVNFKKPIVPIALEETPLSDNFLYYFANRQIKPISAQEEILQELRKLTHASVVPNPLQKQLSVQFAALLAKAQQGDAAAQYEAANCYRNGKGVEKNPQEAIRWLDLAAAQGHLQAQLLLADCLMEDADTPQDKTRAAEYYLAAAEQGNLFPGRRRRSQKPAGGLLLVPAGGSAERCRSAEAAGKLL